MIQFVPPRIRIGVVLISAFLLSIFIMKYMFSPSETIVPSLQTQFLVADASQAVSNFKSSLLAMEKNIQIPQFNLFFPNSSTSTTSPTEAPISTEPIPLGWIDVSPGVPTSTPSVLGPTQDVTFPTIPVNQPTDGPYAPSNIPKPSIQPTNKPKPTPTPSLPPITTNTRPGTSIEEILRDVAKRMCVPYPLLMAERTEESGAWFNNMTAATVKMYNTYGWWTSASKSTVCSGLGYYTQSGLIPSDSTIALQDGPSCTNGAQPGAYDQKIMGLFQVGETEQNGALNYIKSIIPGKVDRRILFDNAVIFSIITKNRVGSYPAPSCTDWPQETVKHIAEKHFGACAYAGGNYCTEIWDLYRSFK